MTSEFPKFLRADRATGFALDHRQPPIRSARSSPLPTRSQMYGSVDADFRSMTNLHPVEHGRFGGDKDFSADLGANHMAVRTNDTVVPHGAVMPARGADNRVLEDDAVASNADGAVGFRHQASAMHDPATCTDNNITTDRRVLSNPGIRID